MGNRAVISTEDKNIGVYLHWNGDRSFIESILAYCDLKEYRSPETDDYGWARLCQILGNTMGGTLSLGIDKYERLDTDNWDNGVYIIKKWDVTGRLNQNYQDDKVESMEDALNYINDRQPELEKVSKDKIKEFSKEWESKHFDRLKYPDMYNYELNHENGYKKVENHLKKGREDKDE